MRKLGKRQSQVLELLYARYIKNIPVSDIRYVNALVAARLEQYGLVIIGPNSYNLRITPKGIALGEELFGGAYAKLQST